MAKTLKNSTNLRNVGLEPTKKEITFKSVLNFLFKLITFPFYCLYLWFFKVPEVPAKMVGLCRFLVFVWIASYTETLTFSHWVQNSIHKLGAPELCATLLLGIQGILLLINLFLSFMEIFGFHDATKSGIGFFDSNTHKSNSNFDAFDEVLEYRDSLLRAKHTPDKIEELKKTGFVTRERISAINLSTEVNEALELANSQMRALHTPGKYQMLKNLFGSH